MTTPVELNCDRPALVAALPLPSESSVAMEPAPEPLDAPAFLDCGRDI